MSLFQNSIKKLKKPKTKNSQSRVQFLQRVSDYRIGLNQDLLLAKTAEILNRLRGNIDGVAHK